MHLLLVVLIVCGTALRGCRREPEPAEPETEGTPGGAPQSVPSEAMSALRVWADEAKRAGVAAAHIARVEALLLEAQPGAEGLLTQARTGRLRAAVREFLKSEKACFTEAKAEMHPDYRQGWLIEGKCYWTAWLLAEAVRSPEITQARSDEIRSSFQALTDGLAEPLKQPEARPARREMTHAFDRLHGDVLFPALKEPITAAERKSLLARRDDLKGLPGRSPVSRVLFELTFDRVSPGLTAYWGHMKWAGYGPDEHRWPVSLAFVPDEKMNRLTGWRRDRVRIARTQPHRPATAPATKTPPAGTVESDWSPAVGGLRGRLTAGPYIARRLASLVAIHVWSVADKPLELDLEFGGCLHWRLTDAAGKEVEPVQPSSAPAGGQRWYSLAPGRSAGKMVGGSRWHETAGIVLELASASRALGPGKYKLDCTLKVGRDAAGIAGRKSAWAGEMKLEPVALEVFAEIKDEDLRTAAASVRRKHGKDPQQKLWEALARLVTPGMTPEQMLIALPPAARQKPKTDDHGSYFFISYPLDLNFSVKAMGVVQGPDKDQRVLTSRPLLIPKSTSSGSSP